MRESTPRDDACSIAASAAPNAAACRANPLALQQESARARHFGRPDPCETTWMKLKPSSLALLALTLHLPATHAALAAGDTAPAFEAPASLNGKAFTYSLADALKHGTVVVYFYPSAYTGGCNLEAHTFATQREKFLAAGATIVGVSLDDIGRLNTFSADPDYCGGKIAVASDADGHIARAYGLAVRDAAPGRKDTRGAAIDHGFAERSTFVVTPDGRVAAAFDGLSPVENVAHALAVVQGLAAAR
jgi:thioredoxin-dependent peroxiredoxin